MAHRASLRGPSHHGPNTEPAAPARRRPKAARGGRAARPPRPPLFEATPLEPRVLLSGAPSDPSSVAAGGASATTITVTWTDNATTESGFVIEQLSDGRSFNQVAIVGPTSGSGGGSSWTATGLNPSTTYTFRVQSYNGDGASSWHTTSATTTSASSIPNQPTGLSATATAANQVALSWTNPGGQDTVYVEQSSNGGNFTPVPGLNLSASSTSCVVGDLLAGTLYTFRVRVSANGIYSSYSSTATATPATPSSAPAAPTSLTATLGAGGKMDLSWSYASSGTTNDGFWIERSFDGGTTFFNLDRVAPSVTSYTANATGGASPATTYSYRVRAYDQYTGDSAYTNTASVTTPSATALGTPSGVSAAATSGNQVRVAWTDNSSGEAGFYVYKSTDGVNFTFGGSAPANAQSCTVAGLATGTNYTFYVIAGLADFYANTQSANSPTATATTPSSVSAPGMSSLSATSPAANEIDLHWFDLADEEDGYRIDRSTDGVNFTQYTITGPNVEDYTVRGLTKSTHYYFRVTAFNAAGDSSASSADTTTLSGTAPAAPTSAWASVASGTQIDLAWFEGATVEDGFRVEISTNNSTWTTAGFTGRDVNRFAAQNLTPNTLYYFRVWAYNVAGDSSSSTSVSATTATVPTPTAPSGLSVAADTNAGKLNLTWTDNSNSEDGFRVEQSADGGSTYTQVAQLPANTTSYQAMGLTEATSYTYRVRAYNVGGNSSYSATDAHATIPATPTGLAATADDDVSIDLSWTDNSAGETGYLVEFSDDGGTTFTQIDGALAANTDTAFVSGLDPNTEYTFRVRATGAGGNSAYSSSAAATTAPAAPLNVQTIATQGSVVLTWDASDGATSYRVYRNTTIGATPTLLASGITGTTYTDTTVTNGTTYYYRVAAVGPLPPAPAPQVAPIGRPGLIAPATPPTTAGIALLATAWGQPNIARATSDPSDAFDPDEENVIALNVGVDKFRPEWGTLDAMNPPTARLVYTARYTWDRDPTALDDVPWSADAEVGYGDPTDGDGTGTTWHQLWAQGAAPNGQQNGAIETANYPLLGNVQNIALYDNAYTGYGLQEVRIWSHVHANTHLDDGEKVGGTSSNPNSGEYGEVTIEGMYTGFFEVTYHFTTP